MTDTPLRVLAIAAHPDDLEFGVAGTLTLWADQGEEVTWVMVTNGAAGSNEPGADLAALRQTRREETLASAAICGVKDVRFLDYQDGALQPTLELRKDLTRIIREVRPQRVLIQDPTEVFVGNFYINHPDHRASGEAALYAVFPSAGTRPIFPDLLAEGYEPHDVDELWIHLTDHADTWVDITTTFDRKIAALLCHKSQVGEDVVPMIRQWNSEAGKEQGYTYAEGFRVMKLKQEPPGLEAVPAEPPAEAVG
jgi:LmbE family N-acetylglucosaminyl deacetylase